MMKKKSGSVKRIARGVFGPSKKTMQKVKEGLRKQNVKASAKLFDFLQPGPGGKKLSREEFKAMFERMRESASSLQDGVMNRVSKARLRISLKYALDAMNVTGKKRERVFELLERARHLHLTYGKLAPITGKEIEDSLAKALGSKAKVKLLFKLIRIKTKKVDKHI